MKVAIIGTGHVGSTYAYTLFLSGIASEIALVNRTRSKALGDAIDLTHGLAGFSSSKIYSGDFRACEGARIVIVTAGPTTKKGQTRLDLVKINADVFKEIIPAIVKYNSDCILIIVTNPVDVLTYFSIKYSGFPPNRVIGSGTVLDSMRFQSLLSKYYNVNPSSVQAFIIGEHGNSMVPVWSLASIKGIPLKSFPEYHPEEMEDIFDLTRRGAYIVRQRKERTEFAVALTIHKIVEAILLDKKEILTVSSLIANYYGVNDVCLSLPAIVGRNGVERLNKIPLSEEEKKKLLSSASILKKVLKSVA